MIKKKRDIALLVILLLIMFSVFLLRLAPEGARTTYSLKPEQVIYYKDKAINCDLEAIQKLIAHYAVNDNKAKYNMWRKKEQLCEERGRRKGVITITPLPHPKANLR